MIRAHLLASVAILACASCSRPAPDRAAQAAPVPSVSATDVRDQALANTLTRRVERMKGVVLDVRANSGKACVLWRKGTTEMLSTVTAAGDTRDDPAPGTTSLPASQCAAQP